jgi:hypothetical protein
MPCSTWGVRGAVRASDEHTHLVVARAFVYRPVVHYTHSHSLHTTKADTTHDGCVALTSAPHGLTLISDKGCRETVPFVKPSTSGSNPNALCQSGNSGVVCACVWGGRAKLNTSNTSGADDLLW